jgi:beta-glucanase (GH16 family)
MEPPHTADSSYVPEGYKLVWHDEFNDARQSNGQAALPDISRWWYETGGGGWGNHELQNYIPGVSGNDTCAAIFDGTLKITAKKVGGQVLSVRMNTRQSWTYGYFEVRLKLPQGKGTWPACWMLPQNFQRWPDDGEIDIMEEVGYRPNWVASSIHCKAYHHSIGTQKTAEKFVPTAESSFHVYAVEWTAEVIRGFVDGVKYFEFLCDKAGNKDTWPFDVPFYLKLNLAWGGDWGGSQGVDESRLPATCEIDYVRGYQKEIRN